MVSKSERKQPFLVNLQEKTEKKGILLDFMHISETRNGSVKKMKWKDGHL